MSAPRPLRFQPRALVRGPLPDLAPATRWSRWETRLSARSPHARASVREALDAVRDAGTADDVADAIRHVHAERRVIEPTQALADLLDLADVLGTKLLPRVHASADADAIDRVWLDLAPRIPMAIRDAVEAAVARRLTRLCLQHFANRWTAGRLGASDVALLERFAASRLHDRKLRLEVPRLARLVTLSRAAVLARSRAPRG